MQVQFLLSAFDDFPVWSLRGTRLVGGRSWSVFCLLCLCLIQGRTHVLSAVYHISILSRTMCSGGGCMTMTPDGRGYSNPHSASEDDDTSTLHSLSSSRVFRGSTPC